MAALCLTLLVLGLAGGTAFYFLKNTPSAFVEDLDNRLGKV